MAEIVTGAMGTLLPKLANLIKEEYNLQKKVRGEIMFLETELKSMEAALIKVSEAPIDHPPDVQVKLWTREVRELSYDLEDSIDRFMVRVGDGKPHSFKGFIDRSLHLLTRGRIQHSIGIDIKEIRSRIKDVSERRDRYKVDLVPSKPVGRSIDNLRLSALYRKATELVGAEEKSSDLVKRLMEGDKEASKQPVVLSIVGFGGLGKTTLANLVYEKIKGQFVCGAFVYVSHNPDVVKVFKNMLYQLDGDKYRDINQGTWSEEQLIWELRKFLLHKRYVYCGHRLLIAAERKARMGPPLISLFICNHLLLTTQICAYRDIISLYAQIWCLSSCVVQKPIIVFVLLAALIDFNSHRKKTSGRFLLIYYTCLLVLYI
jgi:hypothetical protein